MKILRSLFESVSVLFVASNRLSLGMNRVISNPKCMDHEQYIPQVITVSLETMKIVKGLLGLRERKGE